MIRIRKLSLALSTCDQQPARGRIVDHASLYGLQVLAQGFVGFTRRVVISRDVDEHQRLGAEQGAPRSAIDFDVLLWPGLLS